MLNDGDLTKDEWRAQNEIIRSELQSLSNRKVEIIILLKKEKDTDSIARALKNKLII
jgi:site-specific DNA recombinase